MCFVFKLLSIGSVVGASLNESFIVTVDLDPSPVDSVS